MGPQLSKLDCPLRTCTCRTEGLASRTARNGSLAESMPFSSRFFLPVADAIPFIKSRQMFMDVTYDVVTNGSQEHLLRGPSPQPHRSGTLEFKETVAISASFHRRSKLSTSLLARGLCRRAARKNGLRARCFPREMRVGLASRRPRFFG